MNTLSPSNLCLPEDHIGLRDWSPKERVELNICNWPVCFFSTIKSRIVSIASLFLHPLSSANLTASQFYMSKFFLFIKLSNSISYCNDFAVIQNILSLINSNFPNVSVWKVTPTIKPREKTMCWKAIYKWAQLKTWWAINQTGRQTTCKCVYVQLADISSSSGQNPKAELYFSRFITYQARLHKSKVSSYKGVEMVREHVCDYFLHQHRLKCRLKYRGHIAGALLFMH